MPATAEIAAPPAPINRAWRETFADRRLTLGVMLPIEAFEGASPTMRGQVELARRAEQLGFSALWFRDVPLLDPHFGDIGQIYDVWVYLATIAAQTTRIHLATGSVVLPLRHPLHTAKAAASVNELSGGRLILGVASGDRPIEYPAFGRDFERRGDDFRHGIDFLRRALAEDFPLIDSPLGRLDGANLVPKLGAGRFPLLITGHSRQSPEWIAAQGDGWLHYPRNAAHQAATVAEWRRLTAEHAPGVFKPFAQSLYVDLDEDADRPPSPVHLGYRLGRHALRALLERLRVMGVNHVALNFKYGRRPAAAVLEEIGTELVPEFPTLH
jgi:luciferase-type oxidoreductase